MRTIWLVSRWHTTSEEFYVINLEVPTLLLFTSHLKAERFIMEAGLREKGWSQRATSVIGLDQLLRDLEGLAQQLSINCEDLKGNGEHSTDRRISIRAFLRLLQQHLESFAHEVFGEADEEDQPVSFKIGERRI